MFFWETLKLFAVCCIKYFVPSDITYVDVTKFHALISANENLSM